MVELRAEGDVMELPEEYQRRLIRRLREMWAQAVKQSHEASRPEPDPADLAEWETLMTRSGCAEYMCEHNRMLVTWLEAVKSGEPLALKYQAELKIPENDLWETLEKWHVERQRQ